MAIYHCSAQVIARGKGRSAVAAVAYRSGTILENQYDGLVHDFRNKKGVIGEGILIPEGLPEKYEDRSLLWNEIEMMERANAQLAREFETSIPIEIPEDERVDFARRLVAYVFVKRGMIADYGVHDRETDGTPNPHVHVTCPMRTLSADGTWEAKSEQVYVCKNAAGKEKELTKTEMAMPENAEWMKQHRYSLNGDPKKKKVYLTEYEVANNPKYKSYKRVKGDRQPKTAKYGRKNPTMEYWDSKEFLMDVRKDVADFINAELEVRGFDVRVDHRSLKDQGIDREPTIHEGYAARKMEREGQVSDRCETNREIAAANAEADAVAQEISAVEREIGAIKEDITWNGIHQEATEIGEIIWDESWSEAAQEKGLEQLHKLVAKTEEVTAEQRKFSYHAGEEVDGVPYIDYHASKARMDQSALRRGITGNVEAIKSIPFVEDFRYGTDEIGKLHEALRATLDADGKVQLVDRTDAERVIIKDAKAADGILMTLINPDDLKDLVVAQSKARSNHQPSEGQTGQLIRQIQDSFDALHFVVEHGIINSEDARKKAEEIERKYRKQYAVIRRLEAQKNKLQEKSSAISSGAAQGNQRQIHAEMQAIQVKVDTAKNSLPALNREVKEARCCVATFDRIEGRTPEFKPYDRTVASKQKNQDYEARQGMWAEYKTCNEGFWLENKRLSQLYREQKGDGFDRLKALKEERGKQSKKRLSSNKQIAREAISAATEKQEQLNLFRSVYRTYAAAARVALSHGLDDQARACLDHMKELSARQVGYWTGDIFKEKHIWTKTQSWELEAAEVMLRSIEEQSKNVEKPVRKKQDYSAQKPHHEAGQAAMTARTDRSKSAYFDVNKAALRVLQLREDALIEFSFSQEKTTYIENPTYRIHANQLRTYLGNIQKFQTDANGYKCEIARLPIWQIRKKKEVERLYQEAMQNVQDEKLKIAAIAKRYDVDPESGEQIDSLITWLLEQAAEERTKAAKAKRCAEAPKRYQKIKQQLFDFVDEIPQSEKKAVYDKLEEMTKAMAARNNKKENLSVAIERSAIQRDLQSSLKNTEKKEISFSEKEEH